MNAELKRDIVRICDNIVANTSVSEYYNTLTSTVFEIKNQVDISDASLVKGLINEFINDIEAHKLSISSRMSLVSSFIAIDCLCLLYAPSLSEEVLNAFTRILVPLPGKWVWIEGLDQTEYGQARWVAQQSFLSTLDTILEVLNHFLRELKLKDTQKFIPRAIIELILSQSFEDFPWATERSHILSNRLLRDNVVNISDNDYEEILLQTIKPLLVKSHIHIHQSVSESGRQKMRTKSGMGGVNYNLLQEEMGNEKSSWLEKRVDILAIYRYVLDNINLDQMIDNWSFFIPSLLNILDEADPGLKLQAVKLLDVFFRRVSDLDPTLIRKTGIGRLFWEGLMACTTFLPPLTDSRVSIPLITSSIKVLVILAKLIEPENLFQRSLLLDKIMRDSILKGLTYSGSQDVKVASCLVASSNLMIQNMGTYSIKHLQATLEIIRSVMHDPFCAASLPLLEGAIDLTTSLIQYCWPRIDKHQYELLGSISMSWKCVKEDIRIRRGPDNELTRAKKKLEDLVVYLVDAVGIEHIKIDMERLSIIKDSYYAELFVCIV